MIYQGFIVRGAGIPGIRKDQRLGYALTVNRLTGIKRRGIEMARPRKQTVNYFPHDSDASTRKTIYILESKFGNDGYAFWFKLLELLSSSEGHVYDVRNPAAWEFLLAKTHLDDGKACEIMSLLVDLEAIDKELWTERVIWVQKLVDNIAEAYRNRSTDLPQRPDLTCKKPEPTGVSDVNNPHTRLEETKVKEKKEDTLKYGQFENVLLSIDEHNKLRERFGPSTNAHIESLSIGIKSKGYKYKSHYATILNWARRDSDTEVPETTAPAPQNEPILANLDAINEIFRKDAVTEKEARFLGGFQLDSDGVGSSRNLYRVLQCLRGQAGANAGIKAAWTEELTKLGVEV